MNVAAAYVELFGRIPPLARDAVEGLGPDDLVWRAAPQANTVAWLVWHLARVMDHHVSEILEEPQLWETGPWAARFRLDPDPSNTGFGHAADDVAAVRPDDAAALTDYVDAAHARTQPLLQSLTDVDLDRIVDRRWDPPVTLGVRLVSIADDALQHAGQAAFLRGLLAHRERS
jgi:uncharacterized damage-inducible protein DinB